MKTGIVIQARMASTRLPGKVVFPLLGKPVLLRLIERLREVKNVEIAVATSIQPEDDAIEAVCRSEKIGVIRGDSEDVLSRYVSVVKRCGLETIVRVTGDCPLVDPEIVSAMLEEYSKGDYDYYSNIRPRTFPRGLDCEIFPRRLLEHAFLERLPEDCPEYVVIPYVNRKEKSLKFGNYQGVGNHSDLRWTLDEQADYELITRIYSELYPRKKVFLYRDILEVVEREPALKVINAHVGQKSI